MLRVLHVIGAMDRAGAETFLMNLYRTIDRSEIQFDFLVNADSECDYDREILDLGGRIFHIPKYALFNRASYTKEVDAVLAAHPENMIVHGHIGSAAPIYLPIAKQHNRFAIAHSHCAPGMTSPRNILFETLTRPVRGRADFYMGCSLEAGIDRFGRQIVESDHYRTVANGICAADYYRDESSIVKAKKALGIGTEPVFGHIGRLADPKNQSFLLDVFASVQHDLPSARLLLVGRGKDEASLREKAADLGLEENVQFLGVRDDIPDILRAMDVFVFPSLHEGLGIALIEAQAAGLQCIVSEGVAKSAILSERTKHIPLDSPEKWAAVCLEALGRSRHLKDDQIAQIRQQGFDIRETADWLSAFYLSKAQSLSSL